MCKDEITLCPWKCNQEPACKVELSALPTLPYPPGPQGPAGLQGPRDPHCRAPPAGVSFLASEPLGSHQTRHQRRREQRGGRRPMQQWSVPSPLRHLVAAQAGGSARSHRVMWRGNACAANLAAPVSGAFIVYPVRPAAQALH